MKLFTRSLVIILFILMTYTLRPTTIIQSDYEITNASEQISAAELQTNEETTNDNSQPETINEQKENIISTTNQIQPKEEVKSNSISNLKNNFSELLNINNQTKGWLTVNNTAVNYPVVQTDDNDYYLHHNFYNEPDELGWAFLDYRANINDLNNNTIIFGHFDNNGKMFGSLKNVLDKSWYTNPNNQIITFNTINNNMKWQIFSIYTIPVTNDYLYTRLATEEKYNDFVNLISSRSIYDFNNSPTFGDKILTISTCYITSEYRLVIHAKLIK